MRRKYREKPRTKFHAFCARAQCELKLRVFCDDFRCVLDSCGRAVYQQVVILALAPSVFSERVVMVRAAFVYLRYEFFRVLFGRVECFYGALDFRRFVRVDEDVQNVVVVEFVGNAQNVVGATPHDDARRIFRDFQNHFSLRIENLIDQRQRAGCGGVVVVDRRIMRAEHHIVNPNARKALLAFFDEVRRKSALFRRHVDELLVKEFVAQFFRDKLAHKMAAASELAAYRDYFFHNFPP